jgi:hypothetical protein
MSKDPLNVNQRLYGQIGKLLDDLEAADRDDKMTMPQRISALIAIGRIQTIFQGLRKGEYDGSAGSTVRKYAAAFAKPAAARVGKDNPRPAANIVRFDSGGDDDSDSDFDA